MPQGAADGSRQHWRQQRRRRASHLIRGLDAHRRPRAPLLQPWCGHKGRGGALSGQGRGEHRGWGMGAAGGIICKTDDQIAVQCAKIASPSGPHATPAWRASLFGSPGAFCPLYRTRSPCSCRLAPAAARSNDRVAERGDRGGGAGARTLGCCSPLIARLGALPAPKRASAPCGDAPA